MVFRIARVLSSSGVKTTPGVHWLQGRGPDCVSIVVSGRLERPRFDFSEPEESLGGEVAILQLIRAVNVGSRQQQSSFFCRPLSGCLVYVASVLPMRYDKLGIAVEPRQGTSRGWSRWYPIATDSRSMAHPNGSLALIMRSILVLLVYLNVSPALMAVETVLEKDFRDWTLAEAVEILNQSSWAQQRTFTRVVAGIGSGVLGEKEIFNTFFVRFLSAEPIRKAFVRVQQIQQGYDQMDEVERKRFEVLVSPGLELDVSQWIVVSMTFRSNNPRQERRVERFLDAQTVETMKARAFLSTDRLSQVELAAYFPPRRDGVGAKFVFPRQLSGEPIISKEESSVTFEANLPTQRLRVTFPLSEMLLNGEVAL